MQGCRQAGSSTRQLDDVLCQYRACACCLWLRVVVQEHQAACAATGGASHTHFAVFLQHTCHADRQCPTPCPQVHPGRCCQVRCCSHSLCCPIHHLLCFRAWDEHARPNCQYQVSPVSSGSQILVWHPLLVMRGMCRGGWAGGTSHCTNSVVISCGKTANALAYRRLKPMGAGHAA